MTFEQLRKKLLNYPIFTFNDILKWFPKENLATLRLQIFQWHKKGLLRRIKKGLYLFPETEISDQFYAAQKIYYPSYISLETALNYYGIIPDVPQMVTCVTPLTTAEFKTPLGVFWYRHLKKEYFFGFDIVQAKNVFSYHIAQPEKALIDFIYFHLPELSKLDSFKEERFTFYTDFSWSKCIKMAERFKDKRIKQIILKIKAEAVII